MKKRFAVALAALAGVVAMLVPASSHAATKTCLLIQHNGVNIQIGYAPNGPQDCQVL